MDPRYAEWITAHRNPDDPFHGRGACESLSSLMAQEFPELRQTAGYYYDSCWGPQQHWWCVAPDGTVVDPTSEQFPSKGRGTYEELSEDDRPVGCCMDCGSDVFRKYVNDDDDLVPNPSAPSFCCPECEKATRRYLGV
jgi:hypothetical protein